MGYLSAASEIRMKLRYIEGGLSLFLKVTALLPEVEKSRLLYRAKDSYKVISYAQIQKGIIKKDY